VNDDSSDMNASRSKVNDGAEQVNDSKELKHKGNIEKISDPFAQRPGETNMERKKRLAAIP